MSRRRSLIEKVAEDGLKNRAGHECGRPGSAALASESEQAGCDPRGAPVEPVDKITRGDPVYWVASFREVDGWPDPSTQRRLRTSRPPVGGLGSITVEPPAMYLRMVTILSIRPGRRPAVGRCGFSRSSREASPSRNSRTLGCRTWIERVIVLSSRVGCRMPVIGPNRGERFIDLPNSENLANPLGG